MKLSLEFFTKSKAVKRQISHKTRTEASSRFEIRPNYTNSNQNFSFRWFVCFSIRIIIAQRNNISSYSRHFNDDSHKIIYIYAERLRVLILYHCRLTVYIKKSIVIIYSMNNIKKSRTECFKLGLNWRSALIFFRVVFSLNEN